MTVQVWDIRSPDGGSTGLAFARARIDATDRLIAHALPSRITVEVRDENGSVVATGEKLKAGEHGPMAMLSIEGRSVRRQPIWPTDDDLGTPVILPGGEVGILTAWWHADDHSAWRWSVEFSNRR